MTFLLTIALLFPPVPLEPRTVPQPYVPLQGLALVTSDCGCRHAEIWLVTDKTLRSLDIEGVWRVPSCQRIYASFTVGRKWFDAVHITEAQFQRYRELRPDKTLTVSDRSPLGPGSWAFPKVDQ